MDNSAFLSGELQRCVTAEAALCASVWTEKLQAFLSDSFGFGYYSQIMFSSLVFCLIFVLFFVLWPNPQNLEIRRLGI